MPTYIRKETVNAVQVQNDFTLDTPYGIIQGKAGDYVVDDHGSQIHVPKETFEKTHRKIALDKKSFKLQYLQGLNEMFEEGFFNDIANRNYEDEGVEYQEYKVAK
jgi:hypothetical protein